jgi:hypothetical protein
MFLAHKKYQTAVMWSCIFSEAGVVFLYEQQQFRTITTVTLAAMGTTCMLKVSKPQCLPKMYDLRS